MCAKSVVPPVKNYTTREAIASVFAAGVYTSTVCCTLGVDAKVTQYSHLISKCRQ